MQHRQVDGIDTYNFPDALDGSPLLAWMGEDWVAFLAAGLLEQFQAQDAGTAMLALKCEGEPEILEDLGVSQALVSLALNGRKDGINAETYQRIWDHAVSLGYQPKGMRFEQSPPDTRLRLVTHELTNDRSAKATFIQAMVQRGGGFRPETLRKWPVEQLAREIVRRNMETFGDELRLLQLLYVELEPELQIAFLDACGVKHEKGSIEDEKEGALAEEHSVVASGVGALILYPGIKVEPRPLREEFRIGE